MVLHYSFPSECESGASRRLPSTEGEDFLGRILVPVDDSVSSLMAQETAALIARKTGAKVTVLHVVPEFRSVSDYHQSVGGEILFSAEQRADAILSKANALFNEEKVPVKLMTSRGSDPAVDILDYSIRDYDLVVMGACGEHETDLCKLGSVTRKVAKQAHRPILIVKKVGLLTSFLVCTDGSEHSIEALIFSTRLAGKLGAKITLLNVQEPVSQTVSQKTAEELGELVLNATISAIGDAAIEVARRVEFGTPSNVIADVAEEGRYDLLVLGSRGLGTPERFLLGSVSEDVSYNAKCSVLIIPPRE
jgi:nucleotide-binding universal stress UspA family protein